jgi:hypothetical protein
MPPSFPNLELIADVGHDDWSPITNEQEATFDPSGYYALTPAKPASTPYTEVDDRGRRVRYDEPLEEEYATNLGNDTDLNRPINQHGGASNDTDHGVIVCVQPHFWSRIPLMLILFFANLVLH